MFLFTAKRLVLIKSYLRLLGSRATTRDIVCLHHVLLFTVKRLILLENVPACSEAELRAEFPEALNVLDFSFDNDCPG